MTNREVDVLNRGADSAWFSSFYEGKMPAFLCALQSSLERIEDSGINLAKVFSAGRESTTIKKAA